MTMYAKENVNAGSLDAGFVGGGSVSASELAGFHFNYCFDIFRFF